MAPGLHGIRGVGEKTREQLVQHYGSEEAALESLSNLEFDRLFSLEGLTPQQRLRIARQVYSEKKGFAYIHLLKTQEAVQVYKGIMDILKGHAATGYGRLALGLHYPTLDRRELEDRFQRCEKALGFVSALSPGTLERIRTLLKEVHPLKPPAKIDLPCAVATGDRAVYERLRSLTSKTIFVEGEEDLQYLVERDSSLRFVQGQGIDLSEVLGRVPGVEYLLDFSVVDCLPEVILEHYRENRGSIAASLEVAGLLQTLPGNPCSPVDPSSLEEVKAILSRWGDGDLGGLDDTMKKLQDAEEMLHEVVEECRMEANNEILERVEGGAIALKGKDLLEVLEGLERGPSVYQRLPGDLLDLIAGVGSAWETECARRLGFQEDAILFSGLLTEETRYPLRVSQERLHEVETWLKGERSSHEAALKRETARILGRHQEAVEALVRSVLELDVFLALGTFCRDFNLTRPVLSEEQGVTIKGARHLGLLKAAGSGGFEVQPVSYRLGGKERAAVLTGANSGGKTTLLETLAQVQIMAQCGLLVPAERARVPLLEGVYFFGKSRGGTGAGALERLLKSLEGLEGEGGRRLVLADEIEAVTEPGAAAKVIAALLEGLAGDGRSLTVLVTHLGEEVMGEVGKGVRVDGIEAKGLDEDLNLIVERSPVLGRLARSTPELIVERLKKQGDRYGFYDRIAQRFEKDRQGQGLSR
jgi:hypothetical protein